MHRWILCWHITPLIFARNEKDPLGLRARSDTGWLNLCRRRQHNHQLWGHIVLVENRILSESFGSGMDRLATTNHDYVWAYEPFIRDAWVKAQAALLPKGSRVLDAGAGASKYRPYFTHCRYETQDFCQYDGSLVKYLQPIDYVCDITAIPLPARSLDAIFCTEVIEHVIDPMAVLGEFGRLLKPGGRLFVSAPLLSYMHMEPYHFYGGFTRYWYQQWLPHVGFSIDEIKPVGGPGRTSVVYLQAFYSSWAVQEKMLPFFRRIASKGFRAAAKIPIHFILPRVLPKMDRWLGAKMVCSGYLVSATRKAEQ